MPGREGACAFVAWSDVEAIEEAEIGIAHYFEAPEQREAQCAADSAGDFQREREAAQWLDANLDGGLWFSGFHQGSG